MGELRKIHRPQGSGFTLIELMICVAILAITFGIMAPSVLQFGALARESNYARASQNAHDQAVLLENSQFKDLPPEVLVVSSQSTIKTSQARLVKGSVEVLTLDEVLLSDIQVDYSNGLVTLPEGHQGSKVVCRYDFQLPDMNEAHFVGEDLTVELLNTPVTEISQVAVVKGDKLTKLADFGLQGKGSVKLSGVKPGQLVLVDYFGQSVRNQVSGSFLDSELKASNKPSKTKLLRIKENYGGAMRFALPLLKEAP